MTLIASCGHTVSDREAEDNWIFIECEKNVIRPIVYCDKCLKKYKEKKSAKKRNSK